MRRQGRAIWAAAIACMMGTTNGQAAECVLQKLSLTTIDNNTGSVLIPAMLGDRPAVFMIDTGASWSTIRKRDVGDLPTNRSKIADYGAGGGKTDTTVRIPSFKIGADEIKNMDFFVTPDEMSADDRVDGVIGGNFLHNFDLELDLANKTVSFFIPSGCGERVVYWPNSGHAALPIPKSNDYRIHLALPLDGKSVTTLVDTGATTTVLSLEAAEDLFNLHTDSPGVVESGSARTMDGQQLPLYRHQFKSLEFGGVQFQLPWLTLAEDRISQHMRFGSTPDQLILGTHQLRQLHLYIAYKDRMLYATAAGPPSSPEAQAAVVRQLDPLDMKLIKPIIESVRAHLRDNRPDLAIQDLDDLIRRYPYYARGYYERAKILANSKGQEASLPDLDRAIAADPGFAEGYEARGGILHVLHRDEQAKADLDKAVELAPQAAGVYASRGIVRRALGEQDGARADFDKSISLDASQPTAYGGIAEILAGQGQYASAIDEINHAIELRPNSAHYLNNRCWYRAVQGQFKEALADCNHALASEPQFAAALDSRGYIKLKQHQTAEAIADYDAALKSRPDGASSLYGRGLAKRERGDTKGASADILAARKLRPGIAEQFDK